MKYIELKAKLKEGIDNNYLIFGEDRFLCFDALKKIEETAQIQNIMCSIQSSEPENIPLNELQAFFNHISEEFPEATLLWNTYQKDCDDIKAVVVW